ERRAKLFGGEPFVAPLRERRRDPLEELQHRHRINRRRALRLASPRGHAAGANGLERACRRRALSRRWRARRRARCISGKRKQVSDPERTRHAPPSGIERRDRITAASQNRLFFALRTSAYTAAPRSTARARGVRASMIKRTRTNGTNVSDTTDAQ